MKTIRIKKRWHELNQRATEIDITFLILRILTLAGGGAWLMFAPLSPEEKSLLFKAFAFFSSYSFALYLLIFLRPAKINYFYFASLVLDILFIYILVHSTHRLENSFFLGYYMLIALHSIYFGIRFGLFVATLATFLYFFNLKPYLTDIHWTDQAIRIAFLYFIALPLGMLSGRLRRDKEMLESLNKQLTRSLTHLKKIQKKLIAAEKLSALGKLTADIAHEIRNPLTAVGGFARRLNKSLSPETKEKKYAKIIVREVARLEKVLMDTLIYSKPAGLKLKRTDIEKPAANAVKLYANILFEKKIILKENYEPDMPRPYIDKQHIQQAIDSLIWNAVDAMPDGGTLTIATGRSRRNQITYITVSVTDTGVGIPADIIDSIFEPFFTTKRLGVGTGLGLPTVSRIMTEHCGIVKANSVQKGQGTTFTLYFPFQSEDDELKAPCWEGLSCGIATDPTRHCSAYPFFGRICWAVAGSFCEGGTKGICAAKLHDCTQCAFYQTINMSLPLHSKRVDHG